MSIYEYIWAYPKENRVSKGFPMSDISYPTKGMLYIWLGMCGCSTDIQQTEIWPVKWPGLQICPRFKFWQSGSPVVDNHVKPLNLVILLKRLKLVVATR